MKQTREERFESLVKAYELNEEEIFSIVESGSMDNILLGYFRLLSRELGVREEQLRATDYRAFLRSVDVREAAVIGRLCCP